MRQVLIRIPSRPLGRNVHIYSARDTNTVLGGLVATDGMINANFYSMAVFPAGQVGQAMAKPGLAYGNSLGTGLARAYRLCKA